jgi:hypothetical protein
MLLQLPFEEAKSYVAGSQPVLPKYLGIISIMDISFIMHMKKLAQVSDP